VPASVTFNINELIGFHFIPAKLMSDRCEMPIEIMESKYKHSQRL
jgi:hypothetical protein